MQSFALGRCARVGFNPTGFRQEKGRSRLNGDMLNVENGQILRTELIQDPLSLFSGRLDIKQFHLTAREIVVLDIH